VGSQVVAFPLEVPARWQEVATGLRAGDGCMLAVHHWTVLEISRGCLSVYGM
jgi:hypothetical protein